MAFVISERCLDVDGSRMVCPHPDECIEPRA